MGGGDLNLKKSWHPQTMKNIERVWKAEQKHEAERKKIEELQKELTQERAREEMTRFAEEAGSIKKKDDRLDWMYQGPAGQVSRDEYLLGRAIDKQITDQYKDPESGPSAETGLLPGSIFNPVTRASNLDLAAKIREDPLFQIRKREEEKKREVLSNPVKMKKIKEMLRQNLDKKDKKKKRKKEKKEKKDKERRREKREKRRSSSSSSDDEDRRKPADARGRSHHLSGYGLQHPAGSHHHTSASSHSARHEWRRSRSPHRSSKESRTTKDETRASSLRREGYLKPRRPVAKKLSAAELEHKRQEMMDQAKQREADGVNNVKRYKRQAEQEKQQEKHARLDPHAGFIRNMKLECAATTCLEDRVKRNIHSIQRTAVSQDNFMRR